NAGLAIQSLLKPSNDLLANDVLVVSHPSHKRHLMIHAGSFQALLFEMVDLETWASSIAEVLRNPMAFGHPEMYLADEALAWTASGSPSQLSNVHALPLKT